MFGKSKASDRPMSSAQVGDDVMGKDGKMWTVVEKETHDDGYVSLNVVRDGKGGWLSGDADQVRTMRDM